MPVGIPGSYRGYTRRSGRSVLRNYPLTAHVHVSTKHAWKYIAEFSYRRNMRHSHWSMFNLLVQAFALPRLVET